MPIFDENRGLVQLPNNSTRPRHGGIVGSDSILSTQDDLAMGPGGVVPLPNLSQPTSTSNSPVDQLYTYIDDVAGFLGAPVPEEIEELYSQTQQIEGYLADPVHSIVREGHKLLDDIFVPEDEDDTTTPQHNPGDKIKYSTRDLSKVKEDKHPMITKFKGRDTVKNLTLRDQVLWDISIEPYNHGTSINKIVPPVLGDIELEMNKNYSNDISSVYVLDDIEGKTKITDFWPISNFSVQNSTLTGKTLSLFGGSTIQIPEIIKYSPMITVTLADDDSKRWRRWLYRYVHNMYDESTNSIAPYKESALLVKIYLYRQDSRVLSHLQYICTLSQYEIATAGTESSTLDMITLNLSIVGWINLPKELEHLQIL